MTGLPDEPVPPAGPDPAADPAQHEPAAAEPTPTAGASTPTEPTPIAATTTESSTPAEPAEPAEPPAGEPGEPTAPRPPIPSPAALAARPGPRPGPRPTPGPAVRPATPATESASSDSATYGRIDVDGTAYVRLPDGTERVVGQWAAGTAQEGLAFFARKYDDLAVEVTLTTARIESGHATADSAAPVVTRAREALAEPAMIGDLAGLAAATDALERLAADRREQVKAERAEARARALAEREALVAEAESLSESTQWKATGERYAALLERWKSMPRGDRAVEQELWRRFSHARSAFDKRRRQHFARLDSERTEAKGAKEALVREAEALADSTDWTATSRAYRDLMNRWKATARAGRTDEEELWRRFRAAQDTFFAARNAQQSERDAGEQANLAAKLDLLREAEAIDVTDLSAARAALRGVQDRWESVGHVPRGDKDRVEGRLRKVEDALRRAEQERWRRTNPEARARAEDTVGKFRASLTKLERELEALRTKGDERGVRDLESRIASTRLLLEAAERAAADYS